MLRCTSLRAREPRGQAAAVQARIYFSSEEGPCARAGFRASVFLAGDLFTFTQSECLAKFRPKVHQVSRAELGIRELADRATRARRSFQKMAGTPTRIARAPGSSPAIPPRHSPGHSPSQYATAASAAATAAAAYTVDTAGINATTTSDDLLAMVDTDALALFVSAVNTAYEGSRPAVSLTTLPLEDQKQLLKCFYASARYDPPEKTELDNYRSKRGKKLRKARFDGMSKVMKRESDAISQAAATEAAAVQAAAAAQAAKEAAAAKAAEAEAQAEEARARAAAAAAARAEETRRQNERHFEHLRPWIRRCWHRLPPLETTTLFDSTPPCEGSRWCDDSDMRLRFLRARAIQALSYLSQADHLRLALFYSVCGASLLPDDVWIPALADEMLRWNSHVDNVEIARELLPLRTDAAWPTPRLRQILSNFVARAAWSFGTGGCERAEAGAAVAIEVWDAVVPPTNGIWPRLPMASVAHPGLPWSCCVSYIFCHHQPPVDGSVGIGGAGQSDALGSWLEWPTMWAMNKWFKYSPRWHNRPDGSIRVREVRSVKRLLERDEMRNMHIRYWSSDCVGGERISIASEWRNVARSLPYRECLSLLSEPTRQHSLVFSPSCHHRSIPAATSWMKTCIGNDEPPHYGVQQTQYVHPVPTRGARFEELVLRHMRTDPWGAQATGREPALRRNALPVPPCTRWCDADGTHGIQPRHTGSPCMALEQGLAVWPLPRAATWPLCLQHIRLLGPEGEDKMRDEVRDCATYQYHHYCSAVLRCILIGFECD